MYKMLKLISRPGFRSNDRLASCGTVSLGVYLLITSITPAVAGPPAAPSDLRSFPNYGTPLSIDMTWTDNNSPPTNEDGHGVARSVDGGPYLPVATLGADSTSWSDTMVAPASDTGGSASRRV